MFIVRKGRYNRWYVTHNMIWNPMCVIPGAPLNTYGTKNEAKNAARKMNGKRA